ncbi:hypothetical protein [Streptomyces bohaiensis]|uniref:Uncharacterized protein n=1 Tax=Streptomyces bohaiensis TaxID=1431344 RepID=A0ABX1C4P4_9ACTN|nr:hypothetical protein [Streptomyces bohaiensis]NJQ14190.1 hypothetical protein [Streptomyces bohaiensis]
MIGKSGKFNDAPFVAGSVVTTTSEQIASAQRTVAASARDAGDAALLLTALGIRHRVDSTPEGIAA